MSKLSIARFIELFDASLGLWEKLPGWFRHVVPSGLVGVMGWLRDLPVECLVLLVACVATHEAAAMGLMFGGHESSDAVIGSLNEARHDFSTLTETIRTERKLLKGSK